MAAPVSGKLVDLENIPDETFAAGVLGQGVGIEPSAGVVTAPFTGTVTTVADSRHAIGLASPDGMELLIHVGVNTVDMNGKGFAVKVKEGDTITIGQELMTFDRKAIAEAGHPDIVVVLLTNSEDYENLTITPAGPVNVGTEIIRIS